MNLLPPEEKKIVRDKYHKRLAVVGLIFLMILLSIVLISISISYIVSAYEIKVLKRELEAISKTNDARGVVSNIKIIKDTNNKLDLLSKVSAGSLVYDLSDVFASVIDSANLKLTSLSYDQIEIKKGQTKEVGHRIVVGGVADSRDKLRDFVKILQSDKRFSSVDLPVSSLIENKDIVFFITLMVNNKK